MFRDSNSSQSDDDNSDRNGRQQHFTNNRTISSGKRKDVATDDNDASCIEAKKLKLTSDAVTSCKDEAVHAVPVLRGLFEEVVKMVPKKIFDLICTYLGVKELKLLSLTSHALNYAVYEYAISADTRKRFLREVTMETNPRNRRECASYAWGDLIKACTIVLRDRDRRFLMNAFYQSIRECVDYTIWGRCFAGFYENQNLSQRTEFLHNLMCWTESTQLINKIMSARSGQYYRLEMEVRQRLCGIFIDQSDDSDSKRGFYLSLILRTQDSVVKQGRVFMILFGPTKYSRGKERIDWSILSKGNFTKSECMKIISPMSTNLCYLTQAAETAFKWNDSEVFALMNTITTLPRPWTYNNIANLLAICPHLIQVALYFHVQNGNFMEAAVVLHALKTMFNEWGYCVTSSLSTPLIKAFRSLDQTRRRWFLAELIRQQSFMLEEHLRPRSFDRMEFHAELSAMRSLSSLLMLLFALI